jgi:hypothetical protein
MVRHLISRLRPAVLVAAVILPGCGKSSSDTSHGDTSTLAEDERRSTYALTRPPDVIQAGNVAQRIAATRAPLKRARLEDLPPWPGAPARNPNVKVPVQTLDPTVLEEWLHDPNPNVRVHALEAWAQHPGGSLNPATYALVDPDESVRARAQELLEQELDRR